MIANHWNKQMGSHQVPGTSVFYCNDVCFDSIRSVLFWVQDQHIELPRAMIQQQHHQWSIGNSRRIKMTWKRKHSSLRWRCCHRRLPLEPVLYRYLFTDGRCFFRKTATKWGDMFFWRTKMQKNDVHFIKTDIQKHLKVNKQKFRSTQFGTLYLFLACWKWVPKNGWKKRSDTSKKASKISHHSQQEAKIAKIFPLKPPQTYHAP